MKTYHNRNARKKLSYYFAIFLILTLILSSMEPREKKAYADSYIVSNYMITEITPENNMRKLTTNLCLLFTGFTFMDQVPPNSCDNTSPATPTGLTATPGSSKVTLSWEANEEIDLAFYQVYIDGVRYNTYRKEITSVEVTGLTAEQDYTFEVTAVDSSNNISAKTEKVSAPLSVALTQVSVVSKPSDSFPQYNTFFNVSTASSIIPGLAQELIPQGLTYDSVNNWLIAFNYRPGEKSAMLTLINGTTGALDKSVTIYNADQTPYTGHAGGVVVTAFDLWISGIGYLHRIPLQDVVNAPNRSRVYIADRFKTGNVAAFVLYRDGVLWAGEFHEAVDHPTPTTHHKTTRNGSSNRAWMIGFTLNPTTGRLPIGKYVNDNTTVNPDRILSITDKIQGAATLPNGRIALSQSYGRNNDSMIYFYEDVLSQPPHYYTMLDGTSIPSWYLDGVSLDSQLTALPMTEGIVVKSGLLHVLFESASINYRTTSSYQIDKIWKINISSFLKNDR
jgi:hypothetical protein